MVLERELIDLGRPSGKRWNRGIIRERGGRKTESK